MQISESEIEEIARQMDDDSSFDDSGFALPTEQKKSPIFDFFREILASKDNRKVANLKEAELGGFTCSVRRYRDLAIYCEQEKLDEVKDFFEKSADNIEATSMSRKGFLAQLFVTQIRRDQKMKDFDPAKKAWKFGKKE